MGGSFIYLLGNFAGSQRSEEKSMPEAGLRHLGQGSQIRMRSRGGSGRVETRSSKNGN